MSGGVAVGWANRNQEEVLSDREATVPGNTEWCCPMATVDRNADGRAIRDEERASCLPNEAMV